MKLVVEIEVDSLGAAARIVNAQRSVKQHERKIWKSKKTRRELLEMFNSDFDAFVKFACAADVLATVLGSIASVRLPEEDKPQPLTARIVG